MQQARHRGFEEGQKNQAAARRHSLALIAAKLMEHALCCSLCITHSTFHRQHRHELSHCTKQIRKLEICEWTYIGTMKSQINATAMGLVLINTPAVSPLSSDSLSRFEIILNTVFC